MLLRYTLSRYDLFRAGVRALLHQRVLLLVFIPLFAFVWWSTFTFAENLHQPLPFRIFVATFAAGMCAGVGILGGVVIVAAQSFLRRDKGVLGEHTLELTDEGLIEATDVNRSLANWRTVFRIRQTKRFVYIYISDANAHVIPRAKPPLEGSVEAFVSEFQSRIKSFQSGR